jgi:hypothetical protein
MTEYLKDDEGFSYKKRPSRQLLIKSVCKRDGKTMGIGSKLSIFMAYKTLKMEAAFSSENWVTIYLLTGRNFTEDVSSSAPL